MLETSYLIVEKVGSVAVARIRCEKVGSRESPVVEMDLRQAAEETGYKLVVDLSQVTLLASMGLGMLVSLHKHCADRGGKLAMFGLNEDIRNLLKLTHLERLLRVAADKQTAIKSVE